MERFFDMINLKIELERDPMSETCGCACNPPPKWVMSQSESFKGVCTPAVPSCHLVPQLCNLNLFKQICRSNWISPDLP